MYNKDTSTDLRKDVDSGMPEKFIRIRTLFFNHFYAVMLVV